MYATFQTTRDPLLTIYYYIISNSIQIMSSEITVRDKKISPGPTGRIVIRCDNYEIIIMRTTYTVPDYEDGSFGSAEQIHADTNDDLHDGHVGRTQCRVRLHL